MSPASPVIILTGASRGLGLAILQILLSRYNARVATLSRSQPDAFKATVAKFGTDRVLAVQGDVGSSDSNADIVRRTVDKWGGIDGLILNAGSLEPLGRIGDINLSAIPEYSQTNLHSALYLIQPALVHLRRSNAAPESSTQTGVAGRIVLVSSGASSTGYAGWGLYCIAKAGVNALARVLAVEEKGNGVAVWAVRPGVIDMQALLRDKGEGVMDPAQLKRFRELHEKGELLQPEQPAAVLAGLAIEGPVDLSGEYVDWKDDRFSHLR